jgi:hypothetical protein
MQQPDPTETPRRERDRTDRRARGRGARRIVLGLSGLGLVAAALAPSCAAPFDPPSRVNALRVFSVDTDKPYAKPGDTVTFTLHYTDRLDPASVRPVQITWLGGCFDPEGDSYYGCYAPLADTLSQIQKGVIPPDGVIAQGVGLDTFQITLPDDIVTRRPRPPTGPYAGTAFVFFAACAGTVKPIAQEGTSKAGSFPLGCFDDQGNRLGADSFVAGYTQIYAFEDGRLNAPPVVTELDFDDKTMEDDLSLAPHVKPCDVAEDQRQQTGCAAPAGYKSCERHKVKVIVPKDVAEIDPDGKGAKGETLKETVWATYFSDGGDFASDTKLISDAVEGYVGKQEVEWVAPPEAGTYSIWVVVRDSRGGSTTLTRLVTVDPP